MGVRGAISQKAHYQILKNSHQIEAFTSPGNIKLADFTEMKMTLLEGCAGLLAAIDYEHYIGS